MLGCTIHFFKWSGNHSDQWAVKACLDFYVHTQNRKHQPPAAKHDISFKMRPFMVSPLSQISKIVGKHVGTKRQDKSRGTLKLVLDSLQQQVRLKLNLFHFALQFPQKAVKTQAHHGKELLLSTSLRVPQLQQQIHLDLISFAMTRVIFF